ncbi:MAG: rRNA pseudouridine synthase [Defluviitaleaceae bacterium]|nr:rRNA pseudouridine synthase [Defluviitaleaceae bacterium]MCL2835447.1 rRNA pseudouridine synthase [Defluviitaleaceae bacterium]
MQIRLQKYIADCQAASRRKAEELIAAGQISVNGGVITEMGYKIDPGTDRVELGGRILVPPGEKIYIMLHKPKGYITTAKDQFGRPDVAALVAGIPARLFPVGRLDYDTSGLLLMTNDGDLTYRLTHPKHEVPKVYIARVSGQVNEQVLSDLRDGVVIDGKKTASAKAVIVKDWGGSASLKISIHEGRNRQVRKMLDAVGCKVLALKRVATGRIYLGELPEGKYRHLSADEVAYLKKL